MAKSNKPHDFYGGELDEDPDHDEENGNNGNKKSIPTIAKIIGYCFLAFMLLIALFAVIYMTAEHSH